MVTFLRKEKTTVGEHLKHMLPSGLMQRTVSEDNPGPLNTIYWCRFRTPERDNRRLGDSFLWVQVIAESG